jgi:hypothetical protein
VDVIIDVVQVQTLSAPVLGKRSRADADPVPDDLPWLTEVHSKFWKREDLRPDLFRKVQVTRADYDVLQLRLKQLHSDRDSPGYDANKPDVPNVKLNFLLSLTRAQASSSRHPDENDNRVDYSETRLEDDVVLESLFPSLLSFLDMSTLDVKACPPTGLCFPLLLRKDYEDITDVIKKRPQNSGGSVILSGQPGMGEFLVFLFHRI